VTIQLERFLLSALVRGTSGRLLMGALFGAVGFFSASVSQAEEIAIGVQEFPRDLNVLSSD